MTDFLPIQPTRTISAGPRPASDARAAAEKLEAVFLAEMLKSAGLGEQENSFSGSAGEDQFASFQRDILAEAIVKKGGIGLAEVFFRSMMEKTDDT